MLTLDEARDRVMLRLWMDRPVVASRDELVIYRSTEYPWGWVFFWGSRRFLITGAIYDQIAGNGPFIVNRHTGEVRSTSTALPIEHHVELYQDELDLQLGGWKLHIDESVDNFLFVSSRLRMLAEVSLAELRELKPKLPGVWRSGTRREIEPLHQQLEASGVRCTLLPPNI